ncbi:hypothetical protein AKJ09_06329 [Labilithrix luteola]|uniref:Uncharacterized protein n=1 Tax=Labilithrix luteola TaxID=1391654 RepID=A0A0K1Q1J7_9BACT|nr:hypothetical protein [Labilithrix luteola]AKU99665.1 hypothetical protein AKJ09_06329 [Labilithrix luteola]
MNDEPKRLVDEDPGFARLVAASRGDGPSRAEVDELVSLTRRMVSASRWRPWRWLGSGAAIVGASVLTVVAATSVWTGRRGTNVTPVAFPVTNPATEAPLVVGGIEPEPAREKAAAAPSPPAVDDPAPPVVASPRTRTAVTPVHSAKPVVPEVRAQGTSSPASELSTFDEELALLTAARSGLHSHDIPSCLRAIERYESRFGSGLFAEEMQVIRIDALASSGERAQAHVLAQRFLNTSPTSAYAARVRVLAERTRD